MLTKKSALSWLVDKLLPLLMLLMLCLMSIGLYRGGYVPLRSKYVPSSYSCIYRFAKKYHLKHGIASYWNTSPIMAYAPDSLGLQLATHFRCLLPYPWATNETWFHVSYDFALIDEVSGDRVAHPSMYLSEQDIISVAGKPASVAYCGKYKLLIYKPGHMIVNLFARWVPDSLFWLHLPLQRSRIH